MAPRVVTRNSWTFRGLTFELSRHRQRDALTSKRMIGRRPSACWAAWHAVGARLERGVRLHGIEDGEVAKRSWIVANLRTLGTPSCQPPRC